VIALYQECIDKWKLEEIDQIIDEVESELESRVNSGICKCDDDFLNICLNTIGRTIVSMREVLHLLAAGYPDGALCIARNIYENMIILSFLETKSNETNFPEMTKRYFDDMSVIRHKILKSYHERLSLDEKAKENTEELEQLKKKYNIKSFRDYWWCSKNSFNDIVNEVFDLHDESLNGLTSMLFLLYKKACITLHATCTGNVATIGRHNEMNIIETGRTGNEFNIPLFLSLLSFHITMLITFKQLNVDCNEVSQKISNLANENLKRFSNPIELEG